MSASPQVFRQTNSTLEPAGRRRPRTGNFAATGHHAWRRQHCCRSRPTDCVWASVRDTPRSSENAGNTQGLRWRHEARSDQHSNSWTGHQQGTCRIGFHRGHELPVEDCDLIADSAPSRKQRLDYVGNLRSASSAARTFASNTCPAPPVARSPNVFSQRPVLRIWFERSIEMPTNCERAPTKRRIACAGPTARAVLGACPRARSGRAPRAARPPPRYAGPPIAPPPVRAKGVLRALSN